MRLYVSLAISGILGWGGAAAQTLTDADREAVLERLEKLQSEVDSKISSRFRLAVAAYRGGMASEGAAMDLYMKCLEKVEFADEKKRPADFREWKRKEDEKLSDPGLRKALRHQLNWLILTLRAASPEADRAQLAVDAQAAVDAIFRDAQDLVSQKQTLERSVTDTVYAKAYDIGGLKVEKWALSPVQLKEVYEQILLPPSRQPDRLTALRATWQKRIQQEGLIQEHWSLSDADKQKLRIGMAANMRPPAYEKFLTEGLPQLQWEMEVDLFKNGDQAGASMRMLTHLDKHLNHRNAAEWSKQFRELLAPPESPVTSPADPNI